MFRLEGQGGGRREALALGRSDQSHFGGEIVARYDDLVSHAVEKGPPARDPVTHLASHPQEKRRLSKRGSASSVRGGALPEGGNVTVGGRDAGADAPNSA